MSALFTAICFFVASLLYVWFRRPRHHEVPPGPRPLPLVGNLRELKAGAAFWTSVNKVAAKFDRLFYMHIFGQGLVFINDYSTAVELMDRRGVIYSDKPELIMIGKLCGCENMVAFTQYGSKLLRYRRLMSQALNPKAVCTYLPLLQLETQSLLRRMLASPENFQDNIRRYAATLTLLTVYGYQIASEDDPFLQLADECVDLLANRIASGGGIWPVDIVPALRYLPLWAPGAGFLRNAKTWKAKIREMVDEPFKFVTQRMNEGTAVPCFCTTLLSDAPRQGEMGFDPQRDEDIRWVASSIYASSIDTTLAAMSHFLLGMIENPAALEKARSEIDAVIGPNRLPTFLDRPYLPYLECIMSETLRWGVPVPLGLPHRLMEDDIYDGFVIPKGSLVFANIWKMSRDPRLYADPDKFLPERFLASEGTREKAYNPRNYIFGFGRRKCPASNLVEQSLWIAMASMIAVLDMRKAKDRDGNDIDPNPHYNNQVFRIPNAFKSDIRARRELAIDVLISA